MGPNYGPNLGNRCNWLPRIQDSAHYNKSTLQCALCTAWESGTQYHGFLKLGP